MFGGMVAGYVRRNRRNGLVRTMAGMCNRYLSWYDNANYDQRTNGECFVLDRLSRFPIKVVFDVGANVGEWTRAARTAFPEASIYSFEICEKIYQTLCRNTQAMRAVHPVNLGLGESERAVTIHYYEECPALTTTLTFPHTLPSEDLPAAITTGDRFCARSGIEKIDYLKIDAEGMDHLVLAGFEGLLSQGAIDVIQFEYGQGNIVSKFLLNDFYSTLKKHGYSVGKIYCNFVDFRDYVMTDEDFLGPNYLACRAGKRDYMEALS